MAAQATASTRSARLMARQPASARKRRALSRGPAGSTSGACSGPALNLLAQGGTEARNPDPKPDAVSTPSASHLSIETGNETEWRSVEARLL
eukprot:366310-Chlamydomonas_euryale.AAC.5